MTTRILVVLLLILFSATAWAGQGTWKTTPEQDAVLAAVLAERKAKSPNLVSPTPDAWVQNLVNQQIESLARAKTMREAQEKVRAQKAVPTPK